MEDCDRLSGRAGGGFGHLERRVLVSPGSHSSYVRVREETQLSVWCVCVQMSVCMRERSVRWGGELSGDEADLVKPPLTL